MKLMGKKVITNRIKPVCSLSALKCVRLLDLQENSLYLIEFKPASRNGLCLMVQIISLIFGYSLTSMDIIWSFL